MSLPGLLWLLLPVAVVALLVFFRRRQGSGSGVQRKDTEEIGVPKKQGRPKGWTPGEGLTQREFKDRMRNMYQAQKYIKKNRPLIDETTKLVIKLWALQEIYRGAGKSFSLNNPEAQQMLDAVEPDVAIVAEQQFEIGYKNCSRRLLNPRILENQDVRASLMEEVKLERKRKKKLQDQTEEIASSGESPEG